MFRFKKYIGAVALVVIAALGITTMAFAQTATPPATQTAPTMPAGPGGPGGRGGGLHSQAALDAAAKALGMTSDELSAQLWGGKTLTAIAEAKGVDIATVKAAVEAALKAETKTALAQAVTDGSMTQAKADWLLEGLDKGYWGAGQDGGFGMDMGRGHGGPGGPGGFSGSGRPGGPMDAVPNGTAPNNTTPNSNGTTTPNG